jgi:hypothetical protein
MEDRSPQMDLLFAADFDCTSPEPVPAAAFWDHRKKFLELLPASRRRVLLVGVPVEKDRGGCRPCLNAAEDRRSLADQVCRNLQVQIIGVASPEKQGCPKH